MTQAPFELDHVFLCASENAPEADRLLELGLTEGSSNRHAGQGTANRRFFFETTMLELLWIEDAGVVRGSEVRRLGLWERWSGRASGACPFGVCLRPRDDARRPAPFPAWKYRPAYSPLAIDVGLNSEAAGEPFLFYIPAVRGRQPGQPASHPIGIRDITAVRISCPVLARDSPAMQAVEETGLVTFVPSEHYGMQLSFDRSARGGSKDFRPALPLTFSW